MAKEFEGSNYLEINNIMQISEIDFIDNNLKIN